MFAPPVNRLIAELSRMPGVGQRTAQRLAFHILRLPTEEALPLAEAIRSAQELAASKMNAAAGGLAGPGGLGGLGLPGF